MFANKLNLFSSSVFLQCNAFYIPFCSTTEIFAAQDRGLEILSQIIV